MSSARGLPMIPSPGLADPTQDSQQVFRAILEALARPGTWQKVPGVESAPAGLGPALTAVLLTLVDAETPVHLTGALGADEEARAHLAFHTGAPLVQDPSRAAFVVAAPADVPPLAALPLGTDEAPHGSATVLVDSRVTAAADPADAGDEGPLLEAEGPGIESTCTIHASWARPGLLTERDDLGALFPRGIDLIVVTEDAVLGLPRTTRLHRRAEPRATTREES